MYTLIGGIDRRFKMRKLWMGKRIVPQLVTMHTVHILH